jgi:hypothetical protein
MENDWAKEQAEKDLYYLNKCGSHAEQLEYLAAVLRMTESKGACRASKEYAAIFETARLSA